MRSRNLLANPIEDCIPHLSLSLLRSIYTSRVNVVLTNSRENKKKKRMQLFFRVENGKFEKRSQRERENAISSRYVSSNFIRIRFDAQRTSKFYLYINLNARGSALCYFDREKLILWRIRKKIVPSPARARASRQWISLSFFFLVQYTIIRDWILLGMARFVLGSV